MSILHCDIWELTAVDTDVQKTKIGPGTTWISVWVVAVMWSETVLGQDQCQTKKMVLVLQVWFCVVKHGLVTLVVIMILKDTATFQILFIVSLFCARNITTVEINSGVYLLKS